MHTTFVLHGGKTSSDSVDNKLFFKQFTSLVPKDQVKILMCYWALERKDWKKTFNRDKAKIVKNADKAFELVVVNDPEDLFTQLPTSDVLYVAGGEEYLIAPHVPQLIGLGKALAEKVYIGSSMGAFIVSKNYVLSLTKQDTDVVHAGLGLLPVNTLCHWNIENEKEKKITMLKVKDPQIPILLLDEEKFTTLVQPVVW